MLGKSERLVNLRTEPWYPEFEWKTDPIDVAYQINSFHDDDLKYLWTTHSVLVNGRLNWRGVHTQSYLLSDMHGWIFNDVENHNWREVNVTVGNHRPPDYQRVPELMEELERFKVETIEDLKNWYWYFETIHPFEDGNGRVGAMLVAKMSQAICPEKNAYLTVKQ